MKCIYIKNKRLPKGSIQLVKLDRCNPQKTLAGAVFNLYWLNPEIEAYELLVKGLVTGSNGKFIIQNLDVGKYKLVETAAPKGYLKEKKEFFAEIRMDDEAQVIEPGIISVSNKKKPKKNCCCCWDPCYCRTCCYCCCSNEW